jgi:phenylacetic acid degradation operon negative regulatory protein
VAVRLLPSQRGQDDVVPTSRTSDQRTTTTAQRQAEIEDLLAGTRPLNARAVLAAALLGAAQPELPVAHLVAVASLFGISSGAARTCLWRMVSNGELTSDGGTYALAGRLLERRSQVDTVARATPTSGAWDGAWELAVVAADRRGAMDRIGLRKAAASLHLAEIREGTWARPNNLDPERLPHAQAVLREQCIRFTDASSDITTDAITALFDLGTWGDDARRLLKAMSDEIAAAPYGHDDTAPTLSHQFTLSIAVVSHLERDPLLPPELLPPDWPAEELRAAYRAFDTHFQRTMNDALTPSRDTKRPHRAH